MRLLRQLEELFHTVDLGSKGPDAGVDGILEEPRSKYGHPHPEELRQRIRELIEESLHLAGDDVTRLGWILVQLEQHARPPTNWIGPAEQARLQKLVKEAFRPLRPDQDERDRQGGASAG